ncbi:mannitol 1-phosphate dehydrogenase [Phaeosphaeria sp. MPI-PUGE-AT-0046c]|nr:mannitol 1-phosphate dehydrogenase [Phaeosphaeria sp. MPI-PUGE-AT-0046c]
MNEDLTFKNHPTLPIAIVGGGLCGLALAIGLVKHGINVRIYESAPVFSEIGAGVAFGINSIAALQLIDPRLLEGYKKHATFNADPAHKNTFYTMRWGTDSKEPNGPRAGDVGWDLDDIWHPERMQELGVQTRSCIHRAHLLEELISLLPEGITEFSKSFSHATSLPDKTMILHFTDNTTVHCAALLGCDGIKSRVRQLVCPDVTPKYAQESAYRAVVPIEAAIKTLGKDAAMNGHIYCGYGGYIITYPISLGTQLNVQTWPHGADWTVPATREEILDKFSTWYPPVVNLLAEYHLPNKYALFALNHTHPYTNGRVALLGDAAHATVPHLGAGAGMAMEDAYVLSSLIAAAGGIEGVEGALTAYEAVRRARTQEVVRRSLEAGRAYGFADGFDEVSLRGALEESFSRIWGEDLQGEVCKGREVMGIAKGEMLVA